MIGATAVLLLIATVTGLNYFRSAPSTANKRRILAESIAIIPFENSEKEDQYISEGLTEGLTTGLGELSGIRVVSGNSTSQYKTMQIDPVLVGSALNVRAVLTGRVERHGENLFVKVEITDVTNGRSLWTQSYDYPINDLLTLRNSLITGLYSFLQNDNRYDSVTINKCGTADQEAYRLYIKGRYYWNLRTNDNVAIAMETFQQAIDRDPTFALAYVGLANTYAQYDFKPYKPNAERAALVIGAAERALEIDPGCAEAYSSIALTEAYHRLNLGSSLPNLRRSVELSPNYATARHWYAEFLAMQGRFDESASEYAVACSLDPLSFAVMSDEAIALYYSRQPERALEELLQIKQLKPDYERTDLYLQMVYEEMGMYIESLQSFRSVFEHQRKTGEMSTARLRVMNALIDGVERRTRESGGIGYWQGMLDLIKKFNFTGHPNWYAARYHARLGESEKALEFLEESINKFEGSILWVKVAPDFDNLRSDRRFSEIIGRIGLK